MAVEDHPDGERHSMASAQPVLGLHLLSDLGLTVLCRESYAESVALAYKDFDFGS